MYGKQTGPCEQKPAEGSRHVGFGNLCRAIFQGMELQRRTPAHRTPVHSISGRGAADYWNERLYYPVTGGFLYIRIINRLRSIFVQSFSKKHGWQSHEPIRMDSRDIGSVTTVRGQVSVENLKTTGPMRYAKC
jgi:hypothetical protein